MKLIVNDEALDYKGTPTVLALLKKLEVHLAHTALMINDEIVPSSTWETAPLQENDRIEMVVFVGGG